MDKRMVTVSVSRGLIEAIDKIAFADSRSRSYVMTRALEDFVFNSVEKVLKDKEKKVDSDKKVVKK